MNPETSQHRLGNGAKCRTALWRVVRYMSFIAASVFAAFVYWKLAPAEFWYHGLDIEPYQIPAVSEPGFPVYWTYEKKAVRFHVRAEDQCFHIRDREKPDSFAVTDPKDSIYLQLLIFCPGKGSGWIVL
ncbi:hypothetical protein E4K72_16345 [Oxalobacteraceae bacterium OM1]|nr:hypothetical protein E4K72_16345 [Oxalobacteraceae bacterium OM1]